MGVARAAPRILRGGGEGGGLGKQPDSATGIDPRDSKLRPLESARDSGVNPFVHAG